jgi:hypothetical protein
MASSRRCLAIGVAVTPPAWILAIGALLAPGARRDRGRCVALSFVAPICDKYVLAAGSVDGRFARP